MLFKNKILILFILASISLQNTHSMKKQTQEGCKNPLQIANKINSLLDSMIIPEICQMALKNFYKSLIEECSKAIINSVEKYNKCSKKSKEDIINALLLDINNKLDYSKYDKAFENKKLRDKYFWYYIILFIRLENNINNINEFLNKIHNYLKNKYKKILSHFFLWLNNIKKDYVKQTLESNQKLILSEIKKMFEKQIPIKIEDKNSLENLNKIQQIEHLILRI